MSLFGAKAACHCQPLSASVITMFFLLLFTPFGLVYMVYKLLTAGLFIRPQIQEARLGPYMVLYKEAVGPYKNSFNHFKQVSDAMVSMGLVHKSDVEYKLPFGLYHDNPNKTPAQQCRASIGFVQQYGKTLENPAAVEALKVTLNKLTPVKNGELKVGFFPASTCIAVRWPWVGRLSILVAVFKVYPKLLKRWDELTAAGKVKIQMQGAVEVYFPAGFDGPKGTMWVALPTEERQDMLPFALPTATVTLAGKRKEE